MNGSNRVGGRWRHAWRHGTEASCQRLARVARWRVERMTYPGRRVRARDRSLSARRRAWNDAGDHLTFWWRVEARFGDSWPEIFRSCRYKAVKDPGIVTFLWLWADLDSFEGLGRGSFERSWLLVAARGWTFGPEVFRFCRSEADGSSGSIFFL